MAALIFDPFSGISGDMTIGALIDMGLPVEWLRDFVGGLGIGKIGVDTARVDRNGIACTHLLLDLPHEHAHRHLRDIVEIIEGTRADSRVRERAIQAFTLLAEAEAEVHGTTRDRVHFHEVGALDAIVDIMGAIGGAAELGFDEFYTRPVTLGRGWSNMAHGNFPVPPPAVLKLLQGIPVRDPDFDGECTTPTGATLLQVFTAGREPPLRFTPVRSGFGAGTRDPNDRPNCLRLIAIETDATGGGEDAAAGRDLWLLQTDVDDLSPEYVQPLIEAALEAGALDCVVLPQIMKKGRPGLRIEALTTAASEDSVAAAIFSASPSIGIRRWAVGREALVRTEQAVEWKGQTIRVKRSTLPGGGVRAKPEFEDVVKAARALGVTPFAAYRAMLSDGLASES